MKILNEQRDFIIVLGKEEVNSPEKIIYCNN